VESTQSTTVNSANNSPSLPISSFQIFVSHCARPHTHLLWCLMDGSQWLAYYYYFVAVIYKLWLLQTYITLCDTGCVLQDRTLGCSSLLRRPSTTIIQSLFKINWYATPNRLDPRNHMNKVFESWKLVQHQ